jgi:hypothetical protein
MPAANTDGLINCLLQPRLFHLDRQNTPEKFYRQSKILCTMTNTATETKSIGLQANA